MAKSKLLSKIEKLFTGTVEINGNIKRINLERGLSVNKAEKFFVYISNTSGDRDPDFPVPVDCPSLEDACHYLCKVGLKLESNPKNQGTLIFQAETDFPNLPQRQAIGVKIYKMTNNDYECVLSKLFDPSRAPLYKCNSFTKYAKARKICMGGGDAKTAGRFFPHPKGEERRAKDFRVIAPTRL